MINIYTDGSAAKNRSGWGFIAIKDGLILHTSHGTKQDATNQCMELTAVYEALEWWRTSGLYEEITIYSDSAYFCNCYFDKWYLAWQNNGWKNSKGESVANKDLWAKIIPYFDHPEVNVKKVKGHSGHIYNDFVDKLAKGELPNLDDLTLKKNDDKIYIELSEILLDFQLKKYTTKEIIERIKKVFEYE